MELFYCAEIAGKAFVIGEHAVLQGFPAWVTTPGLRFSLRAYGDWSQTVLNFPFHPDSPAGRLASWAKERGFLFPQRWEWRDPYGGAGGMGGSTAEFALTYRILAEKNALALEWQSVWSRYRELTLGRPSGADLVAQWLGGCIQFCLPQEGSVNGVPDVKTVQNLPQFPVLWFLASHLPGRKVNTHLALKKAEFRMLQHRVDLDFPGAIREFVELLAGEGLEHPDTLRDRLELSKIPGVLAVKGCGARMADVLLVVLDPTGSPTARTMVFEAAQKLGLRWIEGGLQGQAGVQLYANESDRSASPI